MADRAIFLDRDNTIIEDKEGYLGDPAKVRLLPGAAAAISSLRRLGYRIIVASNQSGVARGMFTEEDVEAVNQEMCRQLREQAGAHIDASYYCPFHPEAVVQEYRLDHDWRKPGSGMLKQAAEDFGLDLGQCWMIGDSPRDIACGAAAGCRTILIKDPDHADANGNGAEDLQVSPNFIVKSLADAARIVAREGRNPHPELGAATPSATALPVAAGSPAAVPGEAATPQAAPVPAIDEVRLAEHLARALERSMPRPEPIKPVLDEILLQMREENRAQDIPDFSLTRLLAVMAQVLAIACLALGAYTAFRASPTVVEPSNTYYVQLHQLIRAGLWLLGAATLEGLTIALLLIGRHR